MLQQLSDWLAGTSLSMRLGGVSWFVPATQTVHILAIAAVVALLAMLYARLLGLTRHAPSAPQLAAMCLPGFWVALGVLLITGSLLLLAEPGRELLSPAFQIKMPLVAILTVLTALLQRGLTRAHWYESPRGRRLAAVMALCGVLLCAAIVAAGRLIAYA